MVCHVEAGGICNTSDPSANKLCAKNSTCETTETSKKKCKVDDTFTCEGSLPCLDGSSCIEAFCIDCTKPNCLTCSAAATCLSCEVGYGFDNNAPTSCALCDAGEFSDGTVACADCDPSCNECSAAGNDKCNACAEKYYMSADGGDGKLTCTKCSATMPNCDTCAAINSCTTCKDGYFGNETPTCQACDISCKTCSAAGDTNCTTCAPDLVLQDNSCIS